MVGSYKYLHKFKHVWLRQVAHYGVGIAEEYLVTEQVTEIDFQNMRYRPKKLAEKTNKSLVKNEVELS